MNGKTIALIVGLVLLVIAGFWLVDRDDDVNVNIDTSGNVPSEVDDALDGTGGPDGTQDDANDTNGTDGDTGNTVDGDGNLQVTYNTYTSEELDFRILRPTGSSVSAEGEARVKFRLLGPQNTQNSEITDGFTLTFFKDESVATSTTLQQYAEARVAETRESDSEILSGLSLRNVNGQPAYRYSYENMLGSTSWQYVFLPRNGTGYTATYTISDPQNRGYQGIVFNMLESIAFIEA